MKVYYENRRLIVGRRSFVKAVDGISFQIPRGQTLALVGESGCGKTTTARSIVRLVESTGGSIVFDGIDVSKLQKDGLKEYRRRVQFIFQDSYGSLDPRQTIFRIIATPIMIHRLARTHTDLLTQVDQLLLDVNLEPQLTRNKYAHELSGGQRQRVNIARALASRPDLIIADEPVSMLDVSLRLEILNLLEHLRRSRGLTMLFITHDMAAARQVTNRIAIMYLGKIVEIGDAASVIEHPIHPYTKLLIDATPTIQQFKTYSYEDFGVSSNIDALSSAIHLPSGCRFHPRCKYAIERCRMIEPSLIERRPTQYAACDVVDVQ